MSLVAKLHTQTAQTPPLAKCQELRGCMFNLTSGRFRYERALSVIPNIPNRWGDKAFGPNYRGFGGAP
jgi:hypothetical protein